MISFFKRMFGTPYTPPVGDGMPAGNWHRGDLAVCVFPGPWFQLHDGRPSITPPEPGQTYRVAHVHFWNGIHFLDLAEYAPAHSHAAAAFRKAVLDNREACEPEFVTLLKRTKRTVKA